MIRFPLIATLLAALLTTTAQAETGTFRLFLGGDQIGTMSYDTNQQSLRTDLDNTPLGVGDGTFSATSSNARRADGTVVRQYLAQSAKRTISVLLIDGTAVETKVVPASEETDLSDPAAAPSEVLDPVATLSMLTTAGTCPAAFRIYDGRRAIRVTEASRETNGDVLTCKMDYRVTHGPGHLSPFRFSQIALNLTYQGAKLTEMTAETALFTLSFKR